MYNTCTYIYTTRLYLAALCSTKKGSYPIKTHKTPHIMRIVCKIKYIIVRVQVMILRDKTYIIPTPNRQKSERTVNTHAQTLSGLLLFDKTPSKATTSVKGRVVYNVLYDS